MADNFRKYLRDDVVVDKIVDPVIDTRSKNDILSDLMEKTYIDPFKEYAEPPAFISIVDGYGNAVPICTPKEITVITGRAKSKKTYLQTLLASACAKNGLLQNKIKANLPKGKEGILYFDTEQGSAMVARLLFRVKRLIGFQSDNFHVYSLRGLSADEVINLIEYVLDLHANIGIIFVDQIADLAQSINDEKEAVKLVRWMEKLTAENNLHICCVIHQNKGKDDYNPSGWIGTQLLKKAMSVISVNKDENNKYVSHVKPLYLRGIDFDEFPFTIDGYGLPEILTQEQAMQMATEISI